MHTAILTLRVHIDGFCLSPSRYAAALWWRLQGKRLRARARLSPLLGRSGNAYRLWLARQRGQNPAPKCGVSARNSIIAIIDNRAGTGPVSDTLSSLEGILPTIMLDELSEAPGHSKSLSEASKLIDWGDAPWILPLVAGDRLAAGALEHYRQAAAAADAAGAHLVYADDDQIDNKGRRRHPHFKPEWNPELLRHHDYVSGSAIFKVSREAFERAAAAPEWIASLVAGASAGAAPLHLPMVLHHRRARPAPHVPAGPAAKDSGELPSVSIIIPTRNQLELLRTCLAGIDRTGYPEIETVIVDNDSNEAPTLDFLASLDPDHARVVRHPGVFNYAAINNAAVKATSGKILCFLNNDIEIADTDWLAPLVRHAMRDDVGAVGPMLLYPDGTVQHAGVVLGVGGGAGHAHRNLDPDEEGYFYRHRLPQFVSAVTGACLVVRRDRFDAVGGFDERHFAVAFNDVDLCLKLGASGYHAYYEPAVRLVHHESKSRGHDRDPEGARRLASELQALKDIWHTGSRPDPYHHISLSPYSERFVINL